MRIVLAIILGVLWACTLALTDYVMGRAFEDRIYFTVFVCSATAYWLGLRRGAKDESAA